MPMTGGPRRSLPDRASWDRPGGWSEAQLQAAVCEWLRQHGIAHAGDMNAGRRTKAERGRAKAAGMTAGEPDLRIYLSGGDLLSIEMKGRRTALTKRQRERHELLRGLGFQVEVVRAACPADAIRRVTALVDDRTAAGPMGMPDPSSPPHPRPDDEQATKGICHVR